MPVTVNFLAPDLKSLDRLQAQLLVLSLFEDERPLRGVGGLVDWRTCGLLSRFLLRGHVTGAPREITLFPLSGRLPTPRGLLFGLGKTSSFDERVFRDVVERIAQNAARLGARSLALPLPGMHKQTLDVPRAIELFADAAGDLFQQITLLAPGAQRREMTEALRRRRGEFEVASVPTAPQPDMGGSR